MRYLTRVLVFACLVGATAPSARAQDAGVSIQARARTICTVNLGFSVPIRYDAGINLLGRMTELCNNVEGYRLVLDHPAGLDGAAILLDGRRIELAAGVRRTVLVDSSHPAFEERQIGLELARGADSVPMILYAEPKGMVF